MLRKTLFVACSLLLSISACTPDPEPQPEPAPGRLKRYILQTSPQGGPITVDLVYDADGRVIQANRNGGNELPGLMVSAFVYAYDAQGRCTSTKLIAELMHYWEEYIYENGRHTRTDYYQDDVDDPTTPPQLYNVREYGYNVAGQMISTEYFQDSVYIGRRDFTRDSEGRIVEMTNSDGNDVVHYGETYTYTGHADPLNYLNGPLYLFPTFLAQMTGQYTGPGNTPFTKTHTYEIDDQGRVTRQTIKWPDGTVILDTVFEYE